MPKSNNPNIQISKYPTIAIDGPAASGKGTLSRNLANKLNFAHLDTGALYRAVGLEVILSAGNPMDKEDSVRAAKNLAEKLKKPENTDLLSNIALRDPDISDAASKVATNPKVREALIALQRDFAKNPPPPAQGSVLDGRDIGTVICPKADLKLFITASTEVRAERRFKELQAKHLHSNENPVTYEAVLMDMRERDARDQGRKTAPMVPADDALIIDTSHLTADQAMEKAMAAVLDRLPHIIIP